MSSDGGVRDAFVKFAERYGPLTKGDGPVLFVKEVLGVERIDPWQERNLRAFGDGERLISIRACHGPGKTAFAAWCVIYNLLFRYPQRTVATAPSRGQLEGALVAEVHKWIGKLPVPVSALLEPKATSVTLAAKPKGSSFEARTARSDNPEALQGVHEDEGWVLLIADEASGIHEKIFEAASGSMSGDNCQTILLSNPVRTSGFFYDTHNRLKHMWFTTHISYQDSERVSDKFITDLEARYGRDSNPFRVRALGEFPLSDLDTIIPYEFVESARVRAIVVPLDIPVLWGLDVARFGDDTNVLIKRNRIATLPDIQEWEGVDLMQTAGRVKAEWDSTHALERPQEILIDVIGLGAGVVDRLMEQGLPVRGINVGESASFKDQYRNLRTELWFKAREWLMTKTHVIQGCLKGCNRDCLHEKLAAELVSLKYSFTSSGKYMAESKSEMKKRGLDSPNVAEAFILTFASEPAGLILGATDSSFGFMSWNADVSRNRATV